MFIRFNDSNQKYKCDIEKIENDIKVIFYEEYEANISGFRIYTDDGKLLGSYLEHVNIKESFVDGFLFSAEETKKEEAYEVKTFGKQLAEANKKIENLNDELHKTNEALSCTNNAIEELLFNYILKGEEITGTNE